MGEQHTVAAKVAAHGARTLALPSMKEYQAVILRLGKRVREDEDALTDLLNERSRSGWTPALMTQDDSRLTVVFAREAPDPDA